MAQPRQAPDLNVDGWLNSPESLSLERLRGKVVLIEAFQMLCPGCVQQALPQAARVHQTFGHDQVAVIGLHTVFEHHAAQGPDALAAFLTEYGIAFPVGIDRPAAAGTLPETMQAYAMQGTPTLILVDREGRLRRQTTGHVPDLQLGAEIAVLLGETVAGSAAGGQGPADGPVCAPAG